MRVRTIHHESGLGHWQLSLAKPVGALAEYVDSFWEAIGTTTFPREKILPDDCYFLMFNLAGTHGVVGSDDRVRGYRRAWISGLHDAPLVIESVGWRHLVGVRLRLEGAYRFFAMPLSEFSRRVVESDGVLGPLGESWAERLADCSGTATRFSLLAELIARRIAGAPRWHANVHTALTLLRRRQGHLPVSELVRATGVSHKHLIEQFNRQIGLPPKRLARLVKFKRVLAALQGQTAYDWPELIERCGYYDQSHFLREFRTLAGTAPRNLLREVAPGELEVAHSQVNFLQDENSTLG